MSSQTLALLCGLNLNGGQRAERDKSRRGVPFSLSTLCEGINNFMYCYGAGMVCPHDYKNRW